jgi:hypothetical protein
MHISKSDYKTMKTPSNWYFLNLCTTGNVHKSRWLVGVHDQPDTKDTKVTAGIVWFIRRQGAAVTTSAGPVQPLIDAAKVGADIRGVTTDNEFAFPATRIEWSSDNLAVESLWNVGQSKVGNYREFTDDAYWFFTLWGADGSKDISRWSLGAHDARGKEYTTGKPIDWYQDPCWELAYKHDANGDAKEGTLVSLRDAILSGSRVRIVKGNYSIEPDNIAVRETHINAQLLGQVSKESLTTFQDDAYWEWQLISTTGIVKTYRFDVGCSNSRGEDDDTEAISWFVDTRPWVHVLSTDTTGSATKGSKAGLIDAVKAGAEVRYAIMDSSNTRVHKADNLAISSSDEVAAQSIRTVSQEPADDDNMVLKFDPKWIFKIVSTEGTIDNVGYTVGEHEGEMHTDGTVRVKWFINS